MIRVPHTLAIVFGQAVAQDTFFIDIAGGVESVLNAGCEVFGAVRGCGVHHASPGVQGVVVQMMVETFFPSSAVSILAGSSISAYFTHTVGLVWFSYSTSASAKAVSSYMHQ